MKNSGRTRSQCLLLLLILLFVCVRIHNVDACLLCHNSRVSNGGYRASLQFRSNDDNLVDPTRQRQESLKEKNQFTKTKQDSIWMMMMITDKGLTTQPYKSGLHRTGVALLNAYDLSERDDSSKRTETQPDDNNDIRHPIDDKELVDNQQENNDPNTETNLMSVAMIATLEFYKNFISPLLPPACRFVPTCSRYGVLAIQEFGPVKGVILIAWRLLRCSPIGGKGYDPPKWPPVPFTYSSY